MALETNFTIVSILRAKQNKKTELIAGYTGNTFIFNFQKSLSECSLEGTSIRSLHFSPDSLTQNTYKLGEPKIGC